MQVETIAQLAAIASKYPYYKYNNLWTRDVQNTVGAIYSMVTEELADHCQCFAVLLCAWLGGLPKEGGQGGVGRLLTIEEVGEVLAVPVNLKDEDTFHLTIEEYLQSLISLIDELVRPNSHTLSNESDSG